ncbi:MAG: hypothetical protein EPN22_17005 [Nitrospirae bacterium]|nr:MAG: hypothetical protein EPN22_17005 [Nitrospirota bacterium]
MLCIKTNIDENTEGTWREYTLLGQKIRLKIRPDSDAVDKKIRERHKKIKKVSGMPFTEYADEKITEDRIDYLLEDFEGVGDENGKPLEPTLKNKLILMNMNVPSGEISIAYFVNEESKKLAFDLKEDEEKN